MSEIQTFAELAGIDWATVAASGAILVLVLNILKEFFPINGRAVPILATVGALVFAFIVTNIQPGVPVYKQVGLFFGTVFCIWTIAVGGWITAKLIAAKVGNGK